MMEDISGYRRLMKDDETRRGMMMMMMMMEEEVEKAQKTEFYGIVDR